MTHSAPRSPAPAPRPTRAPRRRKRPLLPLLFILLPSSFILPAQAADVSAPAILQWYEGSWKTLGDRTADILSAGYGAVWTPPPGRADSGGYSVGYDVFDRFDLGSPGKPTHYGTEAGLRRMTSMFHRAGVSSYIDLVWNHNGFTDWWSSDNGKTFLAAGGYPGMYMSTGPANNSWGDFHSPFASGDEQGKLSNLIDIAQESNHQFIRNPVDAADPRNLPAGTTPAFGRLANVPDPNNRRFYPDLQGPSQTINLPNGGSYQLYSFNESNPLAGDAVTENVTGYLMRNTQWLVQHIGVDGFRLDATKHMPAWVLGYYDRAVFATNPRKNLDGSTRHVFGFGEYYGSDFAGLQARTLKNITSDTTVGGNRDSLDFPLYFAMAGNLQRSGTGNDWRNVANASFDRNDDGLANNGSQGVSFVQAHDDGLPPPELANVAYAFTLLRPGNTVVYFKSPELATGSFPRDGRGDALGGVYGNTIKTLVSLRNQYGRGDYQQRLLEKELLAYERENSALVLLSNRGDAGYDARTLQTAFPPGTRLVELTGNAASASADPNNDIPEVLTVNPNGTVDARFLRNVAPGTTNFTGAGYLIYGPKSPVGALSVTGPGQTLAGATPSAATNGTARLSSVRVLTGDAFTVTLNTSPVTLPDGFRDRDADGDNAVLRLDDGVDLNASGQVDYRDPANPVVYAFEEFTGPNATRSPGYASPTGSGAYSLTLNAASLSEGYHYLTARAFRRRPAGPAIYTDFVQALYVDRLKPVATLDVTGTSNNRTAAARSADGTANNMHVLLNVPGSYSDAQVLAMLNGATQAASLDVDLWSRSFTNLASGHNVLTVVTFEMTGNYNVQRFPGQTVVGPRGKGAGDVDFNNSHTATDMNTFLAILQQNDTVFNPGADVDGDGHINLADAFLLGPALAAANADAATQTAYANTVLNSNHVRSGAYTVDSPDTVHDVTAAATTVYAYASLSARSLRGTSLTAYGPVTLAPGNQPSTLATLTLSPTGTLDLADNTLTLTATPADTVRAYLFSDLLISSLSSDTLSLGYIPTGSALTIRLTITGDANLDGLLNQDDYALLDKGLATGGAYWWEGDFNHDGAVNQLDYLAFDHATFAQSQTLTPALLSLRESQFGPAYVQHLLASIPEPSPLSSILYPLFSLSLLLRNRTSQQSTVPHSDEVKL